MPTFPYTPPAGPSVFDSPITKGLRQVGKFFGQGDPGAEIMGGVGGPMAAMEGDAIKGLKGLAPDMLPAVDKWNSSYAGAENMIKDEAGRNIAPVAGNTHAAPTTPMTQPRPAGPWDANIAPLIQPAAHGGGGPLAWSPRMIDTPGGSTLPETSGMIGTPHPASGLDREAIEALKAQAMDRFNKANK